MIVRRLFTAAGVLVAGVGLLAAPPAAAASSGGVYRPVMPARLVDSARLTQLQAPLDPATPVAVNVAGLGAVGSDAVAVTLHVELTAHTGSLWAWPDGTDRPEAGTTAAARPGGTFVVTRLGAGGRLALQSSAPSDVVVDVYGWWSAGRDGSAAPGRFTALTTPLRAGGTSPSSRPPASNFAGTKVGAAVVPEAAAAGAGRWAVVGDSLTVGAKAGIEATVGTWDVRAVIGASVASSERDLRAAAAADPDGLLIALGTNDVASGTATALSGLDRGLAMTSGARCRVWATVADAPGLHAHDAIVQFNAALSTRAGVYVADWGVQIAAHADWFGPDGIHLTSAGYQAYSAFLAGSVRTSCPAGGSRATGLTPTASSATGADSGTGTGSSSASGGAATGSPDADSSGAGASGSTASVTTQVRVAGQGGMPRSGMTAVLAVVRTSDTSRRAAPLLYQLPVANDGTVAVGGPKGVNVQLDVVGWFDAKPEPAPVLSAPPTTAAATATATAGPADAAGPATFRPHGTRFIAI